MKFYFIAYFFVSQASWMEYCFFKQAIFKSFDFLKKVASH